MTSPNGSSTPVSSSPSRMAMRSSNLVRRSTGGAIVSVMAVPSARQLDHGVDQLPVGFDLGLLVHADDDIELVLDRRHEIHHRQAVELEIARERGGIGDRDLLLVEGGDQRGNALLG